MLTTISAGALADGLYVVTLRRRKARSALRRRRTKVAAQSTPGRDVVQFTVAKGGLFLVRFGRSTRRTTCATSASICRAAPAPTTSRPSPPCQRLRRRQGRYVAFENFPATQIWYPQFISDVKGFRTLRFMDWMAHQHAP